MRDLFLKLLYYSSLQTSSLKKTTKQLQDSHYGSYIKCDFYTSPNLCYEFFSWTLLLRVRKLCYTIKYHMILSYSLHEIYLDSLILDLYIVLKQLIINVIRNKILKFCLSYKINNLSK